MSRPRPELVRLLETSHALLVALACDDAAGAAGQLRERGDAVDALPAALARAPLSAEENALLARAERAGAEAERRAQARLGEIADELAALRQRRAARPRAEGGTSRSLARA